MPYPQSELHATEQLVLDLHPHWWYFAQSAMVLAVSFLLAVVATVNDWPDLLKYAFGIVLLFTLVWFVERYIRWISTHFVLTSDRVIFRTGIIAKHGIEIPLERINTIFFHQRIFERMLGVGDLEIESASRDGAQRFEDIKNPSGVQNEIYQQMEANQIKAADRISGAINRAQGDPTMVGSVPSGAPTPSIPDQIAQLHQLHASGAITDAEYEAKKAELLDRM